MKARKKKEKDSRKFVAYTRHIGRTPMGVHQRFVKLAGKAAFVCAKEDNPTHADILPRDNVFSTKEAAEKYLAGQGKQAWCVDSSGRTGVPEMFEAQVVWVTQEQYGNRQYRNAYQIVKRVKGTKPVKAWNLRVFRTKKEAESFYSRNWTSSMKQARQDQVTAIKCIAALEKCRPRSKKKGPQ